MKYCQYCGSEIKDGTAFCEKCGKSVSDPVSENRQPTKAEKRYGKRAKKKRFSPVRVIICVVLVLIISAVALTSLGDDSDTDSSSVASSSSTNSKETSKKDSEKDSEQDNALYTDDYFAVEYMDIEDVPGVTTTYLQLKVTNNSKKKLTLVLDDVYINDIAVESGTAMPIELESGKVSTTPFILFSGNTGLTADDIEKVEFKLVGCDDDFNRVHVTKKITVTK